MTSLHRQPSSICGARIKSPSLLLLWTISFSFVGCVSHQQKREQDDKIFALQTHMVQLEDSISTRRSSDQKTGDSRHNQVAANSGDLERMGIELKRMKGDIDGLRVGIETGQMPGQETPSEGSIGTRLSDIVTRLTALESQQQELATAVDRMSANPNKIGAKKEAPTSSGNADLASLTLAFDRRHYKEVAEDAPSILKKEKGRDREAVLMMYGEALLKLNRPKEAALQFNELVELKPADKQMSLAKLRLGDAFKMLGDKDTSVLFYDEVASKYPRTPEGDKAKKALKSMKSSKSVKSSKEKK